MHLQVQRDLQALFIPLSTKFFQVSPMSKVIPKYLTSVDSWIVLPKKAGSLSHVPLPRKKYYIQSRIITPLLDNAQSTL
jgi:hypothetical protein